MKMHSMNEKVRNASDRSFSKRFTNMTNMFIGLALLLIRSAWNIGRIYIVCILLPINFSIKLSVTIQSTKTPISM
jgi:hypothetical protein